MVKTSYCCSSRVQFPELMLSATRKMTMEYMKVSKAERVPQRKAVSERSGKRSFKEKARNTDGRVQKLGQKTDAHRKVEQRWALPS